MNSFLKKARRTLIGSRAFYATVLGILVPMVIQNGITNFVSLLDNLMVGALGDADMSGVSIANQLVFVFNLCIFGGLAGAGIYGAQFYGAGDIKGLRDTFRIKLMTSVLLLLAAFVIFIGFGDPLITLFLKGDGDAAVAENMRHWAKTYLMIMLVGMPAFALSQSYAGTLRETGDTRLPMIASVSAVATNVIFNYLLIFGKLGLPRMGVAGAAWATVISRYVELTIIVALVHRNSNKYVFIRGAYRTMRVPGGLLRDVLKVGAPLLANEALWSIGMSTLTAVYSLSGLTVVSALSITSTISNLFNVVFLSMGNAVSVMVGQALGADDYKGAKATVWKLIFFSVCTCFVMGGLLIILSPYIPRLYSGVTPAVREMASSMLVLSACAMPLHAFAHCSYFTLRSGGKTIITFLFDSGYTWVISVPAALLLVKVIATPILWTYGIIQMMDFLKCILGFILLRKGVWIQNIAKAHA